MGKMPRGTCLRNFPHSLNSSVQSRERTCSKQNTAPTNLTHVIATNNCVTAVSLKWIQPDASWEVHNYIIAYWTKQYGTNTTVKTETLLSTDSNKTEKNVAISGSFIEAYFKVAANFSSFNQSDSRRFWSNTIVVTILKTDCSPIDGRDGLRGTMYVVKLTAIIVGALLGMIIIFFIALRIYVWRKERRYDQNDLSQKERRSHHLMLIEHELPVSTDTFFDHVSAMKFQHSQGFNSEWARLKEPSSQAFSFGNRSSNSAKNRYANVPTFDSTRVALQLQNGKHDSTYINANFVDGIERPKAYIATQAPLPETISDFWRMVWEQEVSYIVMIANTKEQDGTACCKYWPEESEHEYGKVIVKIMDAAKYADYCIRRFEVRRIGSEESRMVWQFQYHSWPTKNAVPVHPTSFLEFVKTVAFFSINNTHPIVVHCSSGNGRTGVFIVVDSQLKRIKMQNNINIFYNVDSTRHQRYKIIRNVEEYIFIHECILDHVTCMNRNDILPRDLEDYINEQKSSFSNEFQKELSDAMNDTTGMHSKSNVAKLPQNIPKNRFENILPFDHSRVKLRRNDSLTSDGHDYINASYCSGLRRQRNYIITQSPMESTVFDFWCMVWENSSFTIAMLLQQEEGIVSYWPKENEVLKAGKIEVRCISIKRQNDFDIRDLELSHSEDSSSRLVRHYQYKTWPENSLDKGSIKSYVDFIVQCNAWHATSKCRTMIVHCRAGTGRSGTFVAISQLIEKLNSENVINVFKTVRRLFQDRMAVIQTQIQYEQLYHAIAWYYKSYFLATHESQEYEDESTLSYLASSIST